MNKEDCVVEALNEHIHELTKENEHLKSMLDNRVYDPIIEDEAFIASTVNPTVKPLMYWLTEKAIEKHQRKIKRYDRIIIGLFISMGVLSVAAIYMQTFI